MRNVRTISIKGFTVNYAIAVNGQLEQYSGEFDTNSTRRLMSAITDKHGVTPDKVVILGTTENNAEYRINDMIEAVNILVNAGVAERVNR